MSEENKELGLKIGRPCCGSRTMCLSKDGEDRKSKFVDYREFKGWYCSVNWFLYSTMNLGIKISANLWTKQLRNISKFAFGQK